MLILQKRILNGFNFDFQIVYAIFSPESVWLHMQFLLCN